MLYREFGNLDSANGGTDLRTFVLKYNAMKFDAGQFEKSLLQDFESIIQTPKKPIKLLRKQVDFQTTTDEILVKFKQLGS